MPIFLIRLPKRSQALKKNEYRDDNNDRGADQSKKKKAVFDNFVKDDLIIC